MAATSPTTAAPIRAPPCPGINRVSLPFCRRRPRRAAPSTRCSRKGEPAVTDVVQEEAPRSPETQGKDGEEEEEEAAAQRGALGCLRIDGVAVDILSIAVPAVLALAADPITTLVDTAFVGHIGSAQLAAVGASASVFNLVSKLFNVPLLNVTTSFVAEQQAVVDDSSNSIGQSFLWFTSIFLSDSPMRAPAEQFLTLRAYGAPPIIVALAAQGAFRGFLDTKTPLYAVGGLLIGRTIAVLLTMTLSTSLAAREGPVPMAAYEICLQVWLTISLLNDALALAGQALLASEYAKRNYKQARMVLYRVLQVGGVTGVALAATLFIGFGSLSLLFTDDPAVLDIAQSGVWFVTISQPVNAIAFVADGLYYGVSDFAYAAYSTLFASAISSVFLLIAAPKFGLGGIWAGLTLFMSLRAVACFWRLGSKGGPWEIIWSESE
nr:unnamed protein product [Digitaria exilis]